MSDKAPFLDVRFRIERSDPARTVSVDGCVERLLGFRPEAFLSGEVSLVSLIHQGDQDVADVVFSDQSNAPDSARGTFNIRLRQANGRVRCVRGEYAAVAAFKQKI